MSGFAWYVVESHPSREDFVRDRMEELGRDVFLPLVSERKPGRRTSTLGPLFPGYLFASLSETEGDLPRVRWMHGVRRILGNGERPAPVENEVVETIRARADRKGKVNLGIGLRRGDRVRILEGPLAGLIGVIAHPATRPEHRVWVLLELFKRATRVELRTSAVGSFAGCGSLAMHRA